MSKRPWFSLYVNDWLSSTKIALLEPIEELGFFRLLLHMWNSPDCSLPDDDRILMRLSRLSEVPDRGAPYESALPGLLANVKLLLSPHPTKPNSLTNDRLLSEFQKTIETSKIRSEIGSKGGRPRINANRSADIPGKQKLSRGESKTKAKKSYSHSDPHSHSNIKDPRVELEKIGEHFRASIPAVQQVRDDFGPQKFDYYVAAFNDYVAQDPSRLRKYRNHIATIRNWERRDASELKGFHAPNRQLMPATNGNHASRRVVQAPKSPTPGPDPRLAGVLSTALKIGGTNEG